MASIVIVKGPNEGNYYPLGRRPMVVGRDEGCPIQVIDELVSRKHLQVRFDDTSKCYRALDMKSANGVFVNGRKIETDIELHDGDEIEIGKTKLLFTFEEFTDRESAMNHWKQRGERGKSTLVR
ncbi:MAG: FHA domain-containing protein [Phycisphaerales bacterium]|nr:FHA domain-containing protein [Phycisphaerales bacterium]